MTKIPASTALILVCGPGKLPGRIEHRGRRECLAALAASQDTADSARAATRARLTPALAEDLRRSAGGGRLPGCRLSRASGTFCAADPACANTFRPLHGAFTTCAEQRSRSHVARGQARTLTEPEWPQGVRHRRRGRVGRSASPGLCMLSAICATRLIPIKAA